MKHRLLLLLITLCCFDLPAQITPERIQQFISGNKLISISNPEQVKAFYQQLHFQTAWIERKNNPEREIFFNELMCSRGLALNEKDYQFTFIDSFRNHAASLVTGDDSLEAEIRITDAAIHFYTDIAYGNLKPVLGYNGNNYTPGCQNIPSLLAVHITQHLLPSLPEHISPALPEITLMQEKLNWFYQVMSKASYTEAMVTSNKVSITNRPLLLRLYHLGITDTPDILTPDSVLRYKVKEAQRRFNLLDDGVLRTTLLQELNVPLAARVKQLILSINYYRWLYCMLQNQSVIVVNIPAAYLKVYLNNNIALEMRVIVGKPATPTPTLLSTVEEVILYPYWHVPFSIATKELLPKIKRSTGFLEAGNYQVLNSAGKVVDPYSINWHNLSTSYFPYLIRQGTGCDNSLGLLKLNFYNPFGVYLHDTPTRNLFMQNKRFFSHGCMRMEKPAALGHLLLVNNPIAIDTVEDKGCLLNKAPVVVPADVHMPVLVWYNPAGIDAEGRVVLYGDIYKKFAWMQK